jgi:hypothetical protein
MRLVRRIRLVLLLVAAAAMPAPLWGQAGIWRSQGPGPTTGGQTEVLTDGEVVGAVQALAPHPTDPDIL